jgi:hypothetical protein
MGFWDDLTGTTAANASRAAAADTYGKQTAATAGIRQAGDQYATSMGDLAKGFQPWQATGQTANSAVANLLADPSSVRSLPGYQFGLDQGNKSIIGNASATGNVFSGKTGKALEGYGVNYADQKYGDHLARLLGVSQQGLGATGAAAGVAGQGLTGQLGSRTSAYNGDMTAAGTIGQGDVAAANARAQGSQNLLNTGIQIAGMAAAPFTGGLSLGASGGFSRLMSGGGGGGGSGYGNFGQYSPYSPMNSG